MCCSIVCFSTSEMARVMQGKNCVYREVSAAWGARYREVSAAWGARYREVSAAWGARYREVSAAWGARSREVSAAWGARYREALTVVYKELFSWYPNISRILWIFLQIRQIFRNILSPARKCHLAYFLKSEFFTNVCITYCIFTVFLWSTAKISPRESRKILYQFRTKKSYSVVKK